MSYQYIICLYIGEDMDECEICYKSHPKAFMKIHMKFRHMSGVNKFYCKYCTASFTEEDAYSQHMKKHSGRTLFRF